MHILFIGYSNLLRKRILPILGDTAFSEVSVAKHESQTWGDDPTPFTRYDSYEQAFDCCHPDLVYVSTINSTHSELALRALNCGAHVIVDKPATLCYDDTALLVDTAQKKGLLVAESTVYLSHPQMHTISGLIRERGFEVSHVAIHFSFPPLNTDNFRYQKRAGGGALFDTGPYIASIGRFFFAQVPLQAALFIHASNGEVDTSFSAMLHYSKGRSLSAFCGFTTEYINRINVLGPQFLLDLDRVFTIPDDYENTINLRSSNQTELIPVERGNTFILFFNEVAQAIKSRQFSDFYHRMLMDSRTMQTLIDQKRE